jgi:sulfide:quinone oxidoreductase
MARQIVILGGGTGGTLIANRLRQLADNDLITVVDPDDHSRACSSSPWAV